MIFDSERLPDHFAFTLGLARTSRLLSGLLKMGLYLSQPKTEKESDNGENHRLRYGLSSMQGWRASMEDAHTAIPNLDSFTSFFGVYDGHGGKAVAKFCAKYLHQELLQHEAFKAGDLDTSLQKTFLRMDEIMCDEVARKELTGMGDKKTTLGVVEEILGSPRKGEFVVQSNGSAFDAEEVNQCDVEGPTAGTTACVAVIQDDKLVVANAGDSRCIISRKKQAHHLSRDHKPHLDGEKDRILQAGGFIQGGRVNGSLDMARAIGDMQYKQNKDLPAEKQMVTANPDINVIELCEDDEFLVLACDGIWDCMSSQQLIDFIHEQLKTESRLSAVCEKVLDKCLAPSAGEVGCDNMTIILIQLKKPSNV